MDRLGAGSSVGALIIGLWRFVFPPGAAFTRNALGLGRCVKVPWKGLRYVFGGWRHDIYVKICSRCRTNFLAHHISDGGDGPCSRLCE